MTRQARWTRSAHRPSHGLWSDALRQLRRNNLALLGLTIILVFVCAGIFAPLIAPYDPTGGALQDRLQTPSMLHWMGTDLQGRDEFSRVLFGARVSLQVGVIAIVIAVTLGGSIGAVAGGAGGAIESVLMRMVDILLAVPGILLAIGIVAWLDQGLIQIIIAVAVSYAPIFARVLRSSLVEVRNAEFTVAARSLGASRARILLRHMLPNSVTSLLVQATLVMATAIIDVAALGFLGLGPPDPRTAEWGGMLTDSTKFLRTAPHLILFPGAVIVLTAVGFNLFGDGLREALDPRSRH